MMMGLFFCHFFMCWEAIDKAMQDQTRIECLKNMPAPHKWYAKFVAPQGKVNPDLDPFTVLRVRPLMDKVIWKTTQIVFLDN